LPLFQFSQSAENQNTHLTPHRIAVPPPRLYLARLGTLII
jgi:hypothetical protein